MTFGTDNSMDDIYCMAYRLCMQLQTGLVNIVYQFAWPCNRNEVASSDITFCDSLGILCFTRALNWSDLSQTKIYMVRAIVFTYTVICGPYIPQCIAMGNVVPYRIGYGHFVSSDQFTSFAS